MCKESKPKCQAKSIFCLIYFIIFSLTAKDLTSFEIGKVGHELNHYWIYFVDKSDNQFSKRVSISQKAKNRRMKSRGSDHYDTLDIPVHPEYIQIVLRTGVKMRTVSNWLNAVSVSANQTQLLSLYELPFVKKITPISKGKRRNTEFKPTLFKAQSDSGFYGNSFNQLNQIQVTQLHASGLTGKNVRILVLDSGFNLQHEVFDSLNIISTYDFIYGDSIVSNEMEDPSNQHNHGTQVLSVLAGYKPEILVGSAFGAEYLLGKTEDLSQENQIEEDYYIAGLEWGEALGADIVSSSIGYIDWYTTQDDLNGQTAPITRAVNIAIECGMTIVTAVGNSGSRGIVAPADAFHVISCGALDELGTIASFSSRGPTADGRIKPEVCAMGKGTFTANAQSVSSYGTGIGTSLATPLISGLCALLLEAHPDWTPIQIRNALLTTADQSHTPDNTYGWGKVNGLDAVNYIGMESPISAIHISNGYPNPSDCSVNFSISCSIPISLNVSVINILGQTKFRQTFSHPFGEIELNLDSFPTGVYFVTFVHDGHILQTKNICHFNEVNNPCSAP